MSKSFHVVESIHKRLQNIFPNTESWPDSGLIGGLNSVDKKDVVYLASLCQNTEDLPPGMMVAGIFTSKIVTEDEIKTLCDEKIPRKTGQAVVINGSGAQAIDLKTSKVSTTELHIIQDADYLEELMIVKATGNIKLESQLSKSSLEAFLENLSEQLKNLTFVLDSSKFILKSGIKSKCIELYREVVDDESRGIDDVDAPAALKNKQKEKLYKQRVIQKPPLLFSVTNFPECQDLGSKLDSLKVSDGKVVCHLKLEVILMVPVNAAVDFLWRNMTNGITSQLKRMIEFVTSNVEKSDWMPQIINVWPRKFCPHIISVIYPISSTDEQLVGEREKLLRKLFLPQDRPLLRKCNRYRLPQEVSNPYLINVHSTIPRSGLGASGEVALVEGDYEYRHYLQDKNNDNGWGCAYRSLQTIFSWFKLQGYTERDVPSHREIQEALVAVGDKEPSFVGTNKWIGSQEVGYVLNQLLKVEYKTLFVSSGADLADKGRDLLHHFRSNGTPVMVGGGQLAHTILGVHFNDQNGDIRFLILDPHYTGGEDLNIILKKGWCGWKDPSFWDKRSFYNLCLPQLPKTY